MCLATSTEDTFYLTAPSSGRPGSTELYSLAFLLLLLLLLLFVWHELLLSSETRCLLSTFLYCYLQLFGFYLAEAVYFALKF